jgi:hypothetical protein
MFISNRLKHLKFLYDSERIACKGFRLFLFCARICGGARGRDRGAACPRTGSPARRALHWFSLILIGFHGFKLFLFIFNDVHWFSLVLIDFH